MRSAINFGKGHLPGATALPYKENSDYKAKFDSSKDVFDLGKLPADKNTAIVFYSDGPTGWKSYKAAVLAKKAGYKKVMWLREGTKGWEAKKFQLQQ
jgi:rhodanese-related sulfurtransferase